MISGRVNSTPTFDCIFGEVTSSFNNKRSPVKAIEHCRNFLSALSELGGPQKEASEFIAEDISTAIKEKFKANIDFIEVV